MRYVSILAVLSLLLSALAILPTAEAIGCPGPNLTIPGPDGDIATHSYYPGCGFDLVLNEGKECPDGDDDWNHIPVWLVNLYFNTCGDPDQGLLNNPFSVLEETPPAPRPFDACPGGITRPALLFPHIRSDCNPDPHATVVGPQCPGPHHDKTPVAYENITVQYEQCLLSAPSIGNPFYNSTHCRPVPENNGAATVTDDCRHIYQDGCDEHTDQRIPQVLFSMTVHYCT